MFRECCGLMGKIFGHRYEARYDSRPPGDEQIRAVEYDTWEAADVMTALSEDTYVCDVCTRCGDLIQRRPVLSGLPPQTQPLCDPPENPGL